eukprot:scaffold20006_cov64-Phaeocystis_antarctica.AAC.3
MVLYERVKDLCGVPSGLRIGVGLVPPYRYSLPFRRERASFGVPLAGVVFPCSMRRRRFHCVCVRRHV